MQRSERGSSIVEYVLLVSLIAIACLLAVNAFGWTTASKYSTVASFVAAS